MTKEEKNINVNQDELAEAAEFADDLAVDTALVGIDEVDEGLDVLDAAGDVAALAGAEAMAGASDLTRAVDAGVVADRLSTLANIVAEAGVNDLAEGAEMLLASDDVQAMSAAVGLMSLGDLDRGLELSRMAGELQTISDVVDALDMPVLSAVLGDRGQQLQEIAADVILRAATERSLAALMEATGLQIAELGEAEMDEGVLRVAASELAAERAGELAAAGFLLELRGAAELEDAADDADLAADIAAAGIAEVSEGAADLGSAETMGVVADRLADAADD